MSRYVPESVGGVLVQECWREILGFSGYWVSNTGLVLNEKFAKPRLMTLHTNQRGIVNVSLNRDGTQFKKSVAVLVARAFVTTARPKSFDTPINLDGDRQNNRADNLLWRPLNYARDYFRQFTYGPKGFDRPVQEFKSEEVFRNSWEAALNFGLLEDEIVTSIIDKTYAWPTYQRFRVC